MSSPLLGASDFDLDELDAFLMSDRAPEGGMQLSDLDGFLAGIAIGPETIPPRCRGGVLSMREALRKVYGTEISTAARIGVPKGFSASGHYPRWCPIADIAEPGKPRSRKEAR